MSKKRSWMRDFKKNGKRAENSDDRETKIESKLKKWRGKYDPEKDSNIFVVPFNYSWSWRNSNDFLRNDLSLGNWITIDFHFFFFLLGSQLFHWIWVRLSTTMIYIYYKGGANLIGELLLLELTNMNQNYY